MTIPIERKRTAYSYSLDPELIAQTPVRPRDAARLLVYDRRSGSVVHEHFRSLDRFLRRGDLLVVNTTRVLPARLRPRLVENGKEVEILLVRARAPDAWEALVKPGRRLRTGAVVAWEDGTTATVEEHLPDGVRLVRFSHEVAYDWLERTGAMPLPPYIRRSADEADREGYQTVYARDVGAVAAPTAGLHFTKRLLERLEEAGVRRASLVLHVGPGTFRPVRVDDIAEHPMQAEQYRVSAAALDEIRRARRDGGRIVAVGTTCVRTLETLIASGSLNATEEVTGWTRMFIYPPRRLRLVSALITNFHLPESTLLMLVSAFAGREETLALYRDAVKLRYRFYSYGDAMLIT